MGANGNKVRTVYTSLRTVEFEQMQLEFEHSNSNTQFEHSVRIHSSNTQFKHSVRILSSNTRFEHSVRTLSSNTQFEHLIRILHFEHCILKCVYFRICKTREISMSNQQVGFQRVESVSRELDMRPCPLGERG